MAVVSRIRRYRPAKALFEKGHFLKMIVAIAGSVSDNKHLPVCQYVSNCPDNSFKMGTLRTLEGDIATIEFDGVIEEISADRLVLATRTDLEFDHIVARTLN